MTRYLLILLFSVFSVVANAANLTAIRGADNAQGARVVIELDAPAEFKFFSLDNPYRVVIDIADSKMLSKANISAFSQSKIIKRVRYAEKTGGTIRVVLELNKRLSSKLKQLPANSAGVYRLVLDLSSKTKPTVVKQAKDERRNIQVVIDPGHGGKDPGAIGPNRLKEKAVVLSIAKYLAAEFNKTPGYTASLTRSTDHFIQLRQRHLIAQQKGADLFISIHADAFTNPQANGSSIYALSQRGASSEAARELARKENAAFLDGKQYEGNYTNKVLLDMAQASSIATSLAIGKFILPELDDITRLHSKRVEEAGFAVLKNPSIPSLLIETGFISNPRESKQLGSSKYRKKMAHQIFSGVDSYFRLRPMQGTLLAAQRDGLTVKYTVLAGDTLGYIAQRYGVSVSKIKQANKISGNVIRVGQNLNIPLG